MNKQLIRYRDRARHSLGTLEWLQASAIRRGMPEAVIEHIAMRAERARRVSEGRKNV